MLESWGIALSRDEMSIVLDVLLLIILVGLWFLWWRQAEHRKKIETQLLEAASQLDAATRMLDEAMQHIARLQHTDTESAVRSEAEKPAEDLQKRAEEPVYASDKDAYSPTGKKVVREPVVAAPKSSQAAQILRMQREGDSPEDIARQMNMPLAQVKLMLMLHKQHD